MTASYEDKQRTLETRIRELKEAIGSVTKSTSNMDAFLKLVRKYTDIQGLTAEIIREFVEKIYVYKAKRINNKRI